MSGEKLLQIGTGCLFSVGGLVIAIIWYHSTNKTWAYVRHWWDSIRAIEADLALRPYDFAERLESKQSLQRSTQYRNLVRAIPILFIFAWALLFLIGVVRLIWFPPAKSETVPLLRETLI